MIGCFRSGHGLDEIPKKSAALKRQLTLFVLLTFATSPPLAAQEKLLPVLHFNHLSTADGLPTNEVRANVVRDRDGYVWIGTVNGLARFDGYGCRIYRHIPDDPFSLSSNSVTSLMFDSKARLWIGTWETGLSLYDPGRDRFLNFLPHEGDSSWYDGKYISKIIEDRAGDIWFVTWPSGLVCVEMRDHGETENIDTLARKIQFKAYALGISSKIGEGSVCERADGMILVGSESGLTMFSPQTQRFSRPRFSDRVGRQLDSLVVQCLFSDSHGDLWVGTAVNGIYQINWSSMRVRNYAHRDDDRASIRSNDISGIVEDRSGYLWITSARGLDRFSPESGKCTPYLPFGPDPRSSTSMKVAVDSSGVLWVGKFTDGVYWLSPKSLRFPHYSSSTPERIPRTFGSIERDQLGNIWLSSIGRIYQVDVSSLSIPRVIDVFKSKKPIYSQLDRSNTFCDAAGNLWYGTWGLGLYRVNLASGDVKNYRYGPTFGADCVTQSIAAGDRGCIWVGGVYEGLLDFFPSSGTFLRMPVTFASNVMKDRFGKIWVASDMGGLYVLDPSNGRTERFAHDPSNSRSLSYDRTRSTYEDPSGRIWVGAGAVIDLWDPATRLFDHYSNPVHTASVFAIPIGSDSKGRLWVRYEPGGVSVLDPSSGIFTNLDFSDGICGGVVDMEVLRDGRILLTGRSGLNIVDPDSIVQHRPAPPLVITRMAVNDEPVIPSQHFMQSGSIRLSYLQNTLEFEFAAIDIDAPHLDQYKYRLEGLEKDWVTPNDRRFVRYASLPPGDYIFHVKAVSLWGAWPDQEKALAFRIAPPWWRTSWAYSFYALLIVSIVYAGYRLRLRQVYLTQQAEMQRFQADHLAEVAKLKSRFFENISHEFRTPLSLILGPIRQAIDQSDNPNLLQKLHLVEANSKKLHGLVNQLLDFSRIESGAMKLQVSRSDVVQFLRRTVMSFESWAETKRINIEIRSEAPPTEGFFDGDKVEKIVNNLMSNALKFTPEGGRVTVTVTRSRIQNSILRTQGSIPPSIQKGGVEGVKITVSDTGPGISAEHLPHIFDRFYRVDETHTTEGTGIGLALTKELADLHHGTITAESTPGKGSVFTVSFPIEQSAYASHEITESPTRIERHEHPEATGSSEEPRPVPAPADGKPIVLIVEDNADLRVYIREYLEADYAVQEAGTGKEGYDRATEIVPDIVISDVMMPEMDGKELCRALKQDVRTSHIPVILLTARAGIDNKIEGLEIGADDYVTKPFDSRELMARVRNLIEQRRQLRKRFSAGVVLKPGEVAVTSIDDALLKKVMEIVEKNMGDENFGVDDLARETFLSRRHLYRKLEALTNLAPAEFIQYIRLQRAHELLRKNAGSIAEVAYQVGFASPSHFSARFHERFGMTPSEFAGRSSTPRPQ
jgi:signal transduction histidine kinase/ligand-binding sensor domain-containing protein/AraC-like DNA-binding protein